LEARRRRWRTACPVALWSAAVAPICVDQFEHSADAANNLTALKKTSTWEQATYVEKGGWATMPGSKAADSGVSQACAAILSSLK
jgi:hypothetical protein